MEKKKEPLPETEFLDFFRAVPKQKPQFREIRPGVFEVVNMDPEDVRPADMPVPPAGKVWVSVITEEGNQGVMRFHLMDHPVFNEY